MVLIDAGRAAHCGRWSGKRRLVARRVSGSETELLGEACDLDDALNVRVLGRDPQQTADCPQPLRGADEDVQAGRIDEVGGQLDEDVVIRSSCDVVECLLQVRGGGKIDFAPDENELRAVGKRLDDDGDRCARFPVLALQARGVRGRVAFIDDRKYTIRKSRMSIRSDSKPWRFVTNHTQVLLCIARDGGVRMRDVAERVGITERAAQRIVADLIEGGYVRRKRVGRRNHYSVDRRAKMRHPAQRDQEIGDLLDVLKAGR